MTQITIAVGKASDKVGYQLWTSETTGYRRRGTKLAELVSVLGSGAVTQTIVEPLRCTSASTSASDAQRVLLARGFDVAGVQEVDSGPVIGMVATQDLTEGLVRDYLRPIEATDLMSVCVRAKPFFRWVWKDVELRA